MTISDSDFDETRSENGAGLGPFTAVFLVLLILTTVWLFFEIGRIPIEYRPFELNTISDRVDSNAQDVATLSSELARVAALAENADRYAHTHYSDLRLKKDIMPLSDTLDKVLDLNGVSFQWNRQAYPDLQLNDRQQIGLIAQEVERVYPELVFTGPDGLKSIDYAKLTPILIEAMKEQQAQIERLERQNNDLDARLSALEAILGAGDAP